MITEDYVSFETAKLLKEKGFDIHGYASIKVFGGNTYEVNGEWINVKEDTIIPTLQMAMKWLREEHKLAISTFVTVDGWRSYVSQIKLDSGGFVIDVIDGIDNGNIPNCGTYEQACETAIKYCLENLITK